MTTTHVPAEERTRRRAVLAAKHLKLAPAPAPSGGAAYEWTRKFDAVPAAPRLVRLHTRTQLTVHHWRGNIEVAVAVASGLTSNAVTHAMPGPLHDGPAIALRLTVTDTDELLIDVSDPLPEFPNFAAAVAGHTTGHGLWQAARLGATLIWFPHADREGKTVRALMTPGPVPA